MSKLKTDEYGLDAEDYAMMRFFIEGGRRYLPLSDDELQKKQEKKHEISRKITKVIEQVAKQVQHESSK